MSSIVNFRPEQYKLIPELLKFGMNYLIDLGLEWDQSVYNRDGSKIEFIETYSYINYNQFSCTNVKIKTFPDIQWFTHFSLPDLIDNVFFKLNGNFYVPKLYIADEPCVIKENSANFYSLFSPLSMYFKERRFTFIGSNFKLNEFLSILIDDTWDEDLIEQICDRWELNKLDFKYDKDILEFFAKKFNTSEDQTEIKNRINQLFFDPWTLELYSSYYNIENPTMSLILQKTIYRILNNQKPSFINLKNKRLVWVEYILKPYFKAIGIAAILLLNKKKVRVLKLSLDGIVDHFYSQSGLNGNEFYNCTNGFSGLALYKASIANPFGTGNLPTEISSIHDTYKGKICPNSVSNKDTGKEVFLVPDQEIDLKFGVFKF
jgi:hypothetical protein